MENTEKIDLSKRPKDNRKLDGGIPSCPLWILGDEKSADNDLKKKFEVKDDHEEVSHK